MHPQFKIARGLLAAAALSGVFGQAQAGTPVFERPNANERSSSPPAVAPPRHAAAIANSDFSVRVVYLVPRNAPHRSRGQLMYDATRKIQQQWAGWGWTFELQPGYTQINSGRDCAYFNTFDLQWAEVQTVLEGKGLFSPTVKYVVFGECTTGKGAAQATQPGKKALHYATVVDDIGLNDGSERNLLWGIGSVGHELGHSFGLWHENCAGNDTPQIADLAAQGLPSGQTRGPMCQYDSWPNVTPADYQKDLVARYGCAWLKECASRKPNWVVAGALGTGDGIDRGLFSVSNNLCVEVAGGDRASDASVIQRRCTGSDNQSIKMVAAGGDRMFHLKFGHSGYCLSPINASKLEGATMVQWPCDGSVETLWQQQALGGDVFRLVNARSGLCLDVPYASTESGVRLVQWSCQGGANQQWRRL